MRLNKLHIRGFKDPERVVDVVFSKTPISVIYGENGSGKTTLLKIIHAILDENEDSLKKENVQFIKAHYEVGKKKCVLEVDLKGDNIEWRRSTKIVDSSSILFGVNRGMTNDLYKNSYLLNDERSRGRRWWKDGFNRTGKSQAIINFSDSLSELKEKEHAIVDFVPINEIEKSIIAQHEIGQEKVSEKVKNAFFNTIASAVDIEVENTDFQLPQNFWERFSKKRDFLLGIIEGLDDSSLKTKFFELLNEDNGAKRLNVPESKIFKVLLVNVLEKAEEKNVDLQSINKLVEIFNSHLYGEKKLVVNSSDAYIALPRNRKHDLKDLSSGERHLLTFLTLFLIIGRGRNFYLIDEPEISLSMKWQRDILPLLSELSPESQIIVATHSPSIANRNTEYLVELV